MPRKKHETGKKSKTWVKTPTPNLIRYAPKGSYYLRGRFGGGPVRESLETDDYPTAKLKLAVRLEALRVAHVGKSVGKAPETLLDALAGVRAAVKSDPTLKSKTRESYVEQILCLTEGRAAVPGGPLRRLTTIEMQEWWQRAAKRYAPQRANHLLMWLKRAFVLARKLGGLAGNPIEGLKRVKVPRTRLQLLSGEQFRAVVASIRAQGMARSQEAADWIEFMTYCGLRPSEVRALRWEHLEDAAGVIVVHGGEEGTKNRLSRRVPMAPLMVELVQRMRERAGETSGPVFRIKKPHDALTNACARLKLPHQRIYDLRHTFATMCAQSGVDVPTFAKWLGHQDGGTLAMRTYVHPDEEHSREASKKVRF